MARVYLGHVAGLGGFGRFSAVKVLRREHGEREEWTQKFLDEARLAASIHHPNVVPVHDVGLDGDRYYLVMDYIRGETLETLLRRAAKRGITVSRAVIAHVIAEVAAGLHAAHELRDAAGRSLEVVHRDAVPRNILVGFDGVARIGDFGIASSLAKRSHTEPGILHGTVGYCAPEYLAQQGLDRRTDVFTLGAVLFEATTGEGPFGRRSGVDAVRAVLEANVTRPSALDPGYPAALEEIVLRALRRCPAERHQTAFELSEALRSFAREAAPSSDLPAEVRRLMLDVFADRYQDRLALEVRARDLLEDAEAPELADDAAGSGDDSAPAGDAEDAPSDAAADAPSDAPARTPEVDPGSIIELASAEVTLIGPPPIPRAVPAPAGALGSGPLAVSLGAARVAAPRAATPRTRSGPILPPPVSVEIEISDPGETAERFERAHTPDLAVPTPPRAMPPQRVVETMVVRPRVRPRGDSVTELCAVHAAAGAEPSMVGPALRPRLPGVMARVALLALLSTAVLAATVDRGADDSPEPFARPAAVSAGVELERAAVAPVASRAEPELRETSRRSSPPKVKRLATSKRRSSKRR